MYEYIHGGNAAFECGKENVIDLSANINPLGVPERVKTAIIEEIPNCERYPDSFSKELRKKIAEFENVNPDYVFCGNGASDIIFRLPRAVNAEKIMITAPTFSDYERSAQSFGSEVSRYVLSDDFNLDGGFIEAVRHAKPKLVFVCNPNNPTGKLTEPKLIEDLLICCKQIGAWVAVDECFLDFTEKADEYTSKAFLERYSNLVILFIGCFSS
jgi:Histidinol-phosphate/aromatic aminotransferase and cobyric acid decarboxylase